MNGWRGFGGRRRRGRGRGELGYGEQPAVGEGGRAGEGAPVAVMLGVRGFHQRGGRGGGARPVAPRHAGVMLPEDGGFRGRGCGFGLAVVGRGGGVDTAGPGCLPGTYICNL